MPEDKNWKHPEIENEVFDDRDAGTAKGIDEDLGYNRTALRPARFLGDYDSSTSFEKPEFGDFAYAPSTNKLVFYTSEGRRFVSTF